jgi:two-component system, LuxR family, response regulator FixJ
MSEEATVFIVDDDPAARESVAAVVESRGLHVRQFESAEEFLKHFSGERNACVLVDVRMAGMSGLELQEELVRSGRLIPTIILTGYGDVAMAVKAMQSGAVTFLEKPCPQEELWSSIERALALAQRLDQSTDRKAELQGRFRQLTGSERDVLSRVLDGQANKRIAADLDIGLRTVELRRSYIMKKTHAASLSELIRMAMEANFPHDLPAPRELEPQGTDGRIDE